jgi:Cupin domain
MPDDRVAAKLADGPLAPAAAAGLVLVDWTDAAGGHDPPQYVAPLHIHHADDEAWYVLEGALRFRLGDEEVEIEAGGAVMAPRGTPHTYWNPRPEPVRYLLVLTPRIFRLIEALHKPSEQPMEALFAAHKSELLGWL